MPAEKMIPEDEGDLPYQTRTFTHPTRLDLDRATEKARNLLKTILPEFSWASFEKHGFVQLWGEWGIYEIRPGSQTMINNRAGEPIGFACLQLSIEAPVYDRMVAEYLLIRNDEALYWKTAKVVICLPE